MEVTQKHIYNVLKCSALALLLLSITIHNAATQGLGSDVLEFELLKDSSGLVPMCGMADPSSQVKTRSRLDCAQQCRSGSVMAQWSQCIGFNFWSANKTCQLFDNSPPYFAAQSGCIFYEVKGRP